MLRVAAAAGYIWVSGEGLAYSLLFSPLGRFFFSLSYEMFIFSFLDLTRIAP